MLSQRLIASFLKGVPKTYKSKANYCTQVNHPSGDVVKDHSRHAFFSHAIRSDFANLPYSNRPRLSTSPEDLPILKPLKGYAKSVSTESFGTMTLITVQEPLNLMSISLQVKAGSRYEELRTKTLGASHFLKRLAFRSNENLSYYQHVLNLDALGIDYSAFNTREFVGYTTVGMSNDIAQMAYAIASARSPSLESWEVEIVKPQIQQEILDFHSNGENILMDAVHRLSFADSGLSNSTVALPHLTEEMDTLYLRQHLNNFYFDQSRSYLVSVGYAPENIAEYSNLFDSNPFGWMEEQFPAEQAEKFAQVMPSDAPAPETEVKFYGGNVLSLPGTGHTQVMVALPGVGYAEGIKAVATAGILKTLIGGVNGSFHGSLPGNGRTSRLGCQVVSGSISAASSFSNSYSDSGLFGFSVQAPAGNGETLSSIIRQQIKDISSISEDEFVRARATYKMNSLKTLLGDHHSYSEFLVSQVDATGSALSASEFANLIDTITLNEAIALGKRIGANRPNLAVLGDFSKIHI